MDCAIVRREETSEEVFSTIFPIKRISSVAFCVSSAWFVAPAAISLTARSTFWTVPKVMVALFVNASAVLNSNALCCWISEIMPAKASRSDINAAPVIPVSSLRLLIFSSRVSLERSIFANLPTISEIIMIGFVILEIVK